MRNNNIIPILISACLIVATIYMWFYSDCSSEYCIKSKHTKYLLLIFTPYIIWNIITFQKNKKNDKKK